MRANRILLAALAALLLASCSQGSAPSSESASPPAGAEEIPGGPAEGAFCEEIGRRVSAEDCEDLNRLADDAKEGVAAFNAPNPMKRGEAHTLQLAISFAPPPPPAPDLEAGAPQPTPSEPAPNAPVTTAPPNGPSTGDEAVLGGVRQEPAQQPTPGEVVDALPGETVEYAPIVGRHMRAELTGAGFDIQPLTPAQQEVARDSVTTWSWRVVAREGGQRPLTLTTVVEGCDQSGQCYPLRSTTQNYPIEVSVGWLGQLEDFLKAAPDWLKLLAAVLAGLTAVVTAFFGLRNAFKGKTAE